MMNTQSLMPLFAWPTLGMRRRLLLSILAVVCIWPTTGSARDLDDLSSIQRETRIVADVFNSALRNELQGGVRVSKVTAEYLAHQGVLVSVRLNAPWLTINNNDTAINLTGDIRINEIPAMVEEILKEIDIDVSPFEPQALDALRDLRSEQRALREEQRNIRAQLRKKRRELVRADNSDARADAQEDIQDLELELATVESQYSALDQEIDQQYQMLRDYRGGTRQPDEPKTNSNKATYDALMAKTACDYGATLKSLDDSEFLTIAVRRESKTDYYVFEMDDIQQCGKNDLSAERLLERANRYSS